MELLLQQNNALMMMRIIEVVKIIVNEKSDIKEGVKVKKE